MNRWYWSNDGTQTRRFSFNTGVTRKCAERYPYRTYSIVLTYNLIRIAVVKCIESMPSSSSTSWIVTAVAGGAIAAAVAIWRISEKKAKRRKSATDSENDSSATTVSVEGR